MKTPITIKRVRQHLAYSSWKYLLLVCAVIFGWNLVYTVTAYRPPQEKIVDIYIYSFGEQLDELNAYMTDVRQNEMSDMEQMTASYIMPDETYGTMLLSTRMAACEGDIYILPRDTFQSCASEGWFVELETISGVQETCEALGADLERCWRRNTETRERHLYGLPISAFPRLKEMALLGDDYYLTVVVNNGNDENVLNFLRILLRDMTESPALPDAAS